MDLSKHLETAAEAVKRRNYPYAVKLYHQLLSLRVQLRLDQCVGTLKGIGFNVNHLGSQ